MSDTKGTAADLVVMGKVYTAEDDKVVEAFAVRDGRYVYVGDRKGAEAYVVQGTTKVVDHTGKGLVMPSCGNGHAHYTMAHALGMVGCMVDARTSVDTFLGEIVPGAVKAAKERGATCVFGFGWDYMAFKDNMPTRQQLDAICDDIPIYFSDEEGHKGLVNTCCLVRAHIMDEDGGVLMREVRGGEIAFGEDGTPSGFLNEQAGTYVRSFLDNDALLSIDVARECIARVQEQMLSEGYTMYVDGWGTYFYNDHFYQGALQMDEADDLHIVMGLTYEIESWMDTDAALTEATDVKRYASAHVLPRWVKLFMDGTVESGTGFVDPLYSDGHQGLVNWSEEEATEITRKANANGLSMHVHTMGNKAVNRTINAFANGGEDGMRNTLVHVRNVYPADWQRMADHNICAVAGMHWHHLTDEEREMIKDMVPAGMDEEMYPMRSYFDHGISVSSHSDFPALSGSPDDPFGIMGIAVTGVMDRQIEHPIWPEELLTREQALTALTIGCARQMFVEDERGSVSVGKYADFLLVDTDVLSCPADRIGAARTCATYFEGREVFRRP